jgi:hypothetical protein
MRKFYEKKLKQKAFDALKENHVEIQNELTRLDTAQRFDVKWTKVIFFTKWTDKLDARREINMMHLIYKARVHYESRIRRRCLTTWICYLNERRLHNVTGRI